MNESEEAAQLEAAQFTLWLHTLTYGELYQQEETSTAEGTDDKVQLVRDELQRRANGGERVLYVHDCLDCTYVTSTGIGGKLVDFYYHKRHHGTEYIWRYGNNGPDYYCVTEFKKK
jgi:hypothetical protein